MDRSCVMANKFVSTVTGRVDQRPFVENREAAGC